MTGFVELLRLWCTASAFVVRSPLAVSWRDRSPGSFPRALLGHFSCSGSDMSIPSRLYLTCGTPLSEFRLGQKVRDRRCEYRDLRFDQLSLFRGEHRICAREEAKRGGRSSNTRRTDEIYWRMNGTRDAYRPGSAFHCFRHLNIIPGTIGG